MAGSCDVVVEESGRVMIVARFGFEEVAAPRTVEEAHAAWKAELAR